MSTTLQEPTLKKISCGEGHTIVVAESGMGFACGEGTFGELGNERFRVTQCLDLIKNGYDNDGTDACGRKRIIHVACGAHHSLLITSDGFLYTFGDESHGELGHGPKNYYRALDGNKRSNNIPMLNRYLLSYDYDPATKFDVKSLRFPIAVTFASAGDGYSVIVDQSGTVWTWGANTYGNLGVGDTSNRHFPTRVESLTNQHEIVKEVHAGAEHVLAITVQGSCWTWGHGDGGRLGRGDVYDSTVPAYVSHLSTVFVSTGGAGDAHTAVVSDNGALWIWGTGSFGRLGLGDERDKCVPQHVIFPLYTQEDIDKRESGEHNENEEEKGKDNTENTSESSSSASQSKGSTGGVGYSAIDPITSVVCGTTNTLCITESKRLFAFGGGLYGKNGTGDEKNRTRPTVVTSLQHEQVTDVACGSFHTMVLTASGTIYGCGFGGALNSRLGLGVSEADQLTSANKVKTHSKFLIPTPVVNMPPRAIMMEEQEKASLGGVSPRHLFFTGEEYDVEHAKHNGDDGGGDDNEMGEASLESLSMNDPNAMDLIALTSVMPLSTVIQISCGRHHSMFLTLGGRLFACGENECGQLGINSQDDAMLPTIINHNIGHERIVSVACGAAHTLALTARGVGYAWGRGLEGQLGTGKNIEAQTTPSKLIMTTTIGFSHVAGGEEYSGGIATLSGYLYTWGTGDMGQLGHGTSSNGDSGGATKSSSSSLSIVETKETNLNSTSCWTPRRVPGINERVIELSLGTTHTAALTELGQVYTWGSGWHGKLGHGGLNNCWVPTLVQFFSKCIVKHISISTFHSMAVDDSGTLYAWGRGDQRLGLGPIDADVLIPHRNDDLWAHNIVPVVICAGESHNMIVSKKGGEVYSFGSGNYGKLGIATRNDLKDHRTNIDSANPANVRDIDGEPLELGELPDFAIKQGKLDIRSVSCYSNHSLALSRDGNIYSWGNGGSGRLATGDTDDQPVAKIVESIQSQFTAERAIGDDSVGGGGDGEDDDDEDDAGGGGSQGDGSLRDLLQRVTTYNENQSKIYPSVPKLAQLMYLEPSGCLINHLRQSFASIAIDNNNLDDLMRKVQVREEIVVGIENQIHTAVTATVQKLYPKDAGGNNKLAKEAMAQAKVLKKKKITEDALDEMEQQQMAAKKRKNESKRLKNKGNDTSNKKKDVEKDATSKKKRRNNKTSKSTKKEKESNGTKKNENDGTLPKSIVSCLGAYVQIFSLLRAHPCYLIDLYKYTFHNHDGPNNLIRTVGSRIKFSSRRFFNLMTTIFGDLQEEAHQHLFLLVTKQIVKVELSEVYDKCKGNLDTFERMLFGTDENEEGMSVGTRCIRYYFCNALEMNSCLRDNLSRPTGHLSSSQESLNCDPIAVAKERGQNIPKKKSPKDIQQQQKTLYGRLLIKNIINDRKGEASEMIKLFINSTRNMLKTLPYGGAWLLHVIYEYVLLMFRDGGNSNSNININDNSNDNETKYEDNNGNDKNDDEDAFDLPSRVRHLLARILVTSCVLPAVRNWKDLHLLPSDTKPSPPFSSNIRWLRVILPIIIGNLSVPENDWNKIIVMQKERCAQQVSNSVSSMLGSVDGSEMANRLTINLYQDRLRENDLIITVNINTFFFLRWLILVAGHGPMFESVEHHRTTKFNRNTQRALRDEEGDQIPDADDDKVRVEMSENNTTSTIKSTDSQVQAKMAMHLWGSSGLIGSVPDYLEAHNFERMKGNLNDGNDAAANLSLQTRMIQDVGGERLAQLCQNCGAICAPVLCTNDCVGMEMAGPEESAVSVLTIGKLAIRDLLRDGRLPPDIKDTGGSSNSSSSSSSSSSGNGSGGNSKGSVVKRLKTYWGKQLREARRKHLYNDATLLSNAIEQLDAMREESALEIEKQRVGDMIYEILIDMIKRRKLYERLQSHLKSTRQLKRDIRLYLESLITRQKYLENYRHALRYGQSEQQNRRVVAMEARSSLRKVKFLGLITCCLYGKLTNPQLIEATNKDLVPDKIAKALGARSLVTGIMRTVTYRHLRDRHAIYMFRFGIQTMGNDGAEGGNKTIDLESLFKEDEETNATEGKKGEGLPNEGKKEQGNVTAKKSIKGDVNSKFGLADPTSLSPLHYQHVSTLGGDPVRGATIPGVTRNHVKKNLKYRFVESSTGCFNVLGLYKETTVIDSFELKMSHMSNLLELQTRLYTPENSNTTFVLPTLVQFVGELQMRSVLM